MPAKLMKYVGLRGVKKLGYESVLFLVATGEQA
jgi:hypothetical protein